MMGGREPAWEAGAKLARHIRQKGGRQDQMIRLYNQFVSVVSINRYQKCGDRDADLNVERVNRMARDNLDAIAAQMESILSEVPCVSYRSSMELVWPILMLAQPEIRQVLSKLRFFLVPLDDPDLTTKMVNTDRVDLLKAMACVAPSPHAQPGGRLSDAVGAALSLLQDVDVRTSTSHNVVWDHNYHQGPCK